MDPDIVIENHLRICEDAYTILSEENHLLKPNGSGINERFIKKKQALLKDLEESLISLQQIDTNSLNKNEGTENLINKSQKKLMQIFLLDRENERLLTSRSNTSMRDKTESPQGLAPPPQKANTTGSNPRANRTYGENST